MPANAGIFYLLFKEQPEPCVLARKKRKNGLPHIPAVCSQ